MVKYNRHLETHISTFVVTYRGFISIQVIDIESL